MPTAALKFYSLVSLVSHLGHLCAAEREIWVIRMRARNIIIPMRGVLRERARRHARFSTRWLDDVRLVSWSFFFSGKSSPENSKNTRSPRHFPFRSFPNFLDSWLKDLLFLLEVGNQDLFWMKMVCLFFSDTKKTFSKSGLAPVSKHCFTELHHAVLHNSYQLVSPEFFTKSIRWQWSGSFDERFMKFFLFLHIPTNVDKFSRYSWQAKHWFTNALQGCWHTNPMHFQ